VKKEVTVSAALKTGKVLLIILPLVFFLATLIFGSILISETGADGLWALALLIISIAISWIYWSLAVTYWRIWAFSNVRNVHELQFKAVRNKLIWPPGSFFARTEISTASQRQTLKALEQKVTYPDIFVDDPSVSKETLIRFSKRNQIITFCIGLVCIVIGLYYVLAEDQYLMAILFFAGDFFVIKSYRQMRNREIQLVLNEKGMQIKDGPFIGWQHLSHIDISGGHMTYHIGSVSAHVLELVEYDHKVSEIEKRIGIYQGRFANSGKPD